MQQGLSDEPRAGAEKSSWAKDRAGWWGAGTRGARGPRAATLLATLHKCHSRKTLQSTGRYNISNIFSVPHYIGIPMS
jgi:hypothetical protein